MLSWRPPRPGRSIQVQHTQPNIGMPAAVHAGASADDLHGLGIGCGGSTAKSALTHLQPASVVERMQVRSTGCPMHARSYRRSHRLSLSATLAAHARRRALIIHQRGRPHQSSRSRSWSSACGTGNAPRDIAGTAAMFARMTRQLPQDHRRPRRSDSAACACCRHPAVGPRPRSTDWS